MTKNYLLFAFLIFHVNIFGQSMLTGEINDYAKIISVDPCESMLTIEGNNVFSKDDTVLLIQMKGAMIDESNSSSFGDVLDMGSAGLFEKNFIDSISGQEIFLKNTFSNDYDLSGSVQLVSVPSYDNATITDTLKAKPWNGNTGGVLIFEVTGELVFDAPIDVSGMGFRGGETETQSSNCNFLTNANNYHYDLTNWRGAPKGEGIADLIIGKEQGRGAQANGGGGGNDHNAGGGGGSNITSGGEGGKTSTSGLGCDGDFPGIGGKSLSSMETTWFMGGGGGAGHDNNGGGTNGGNGGGIVVVLANSVTANNQSIMANGQDAWHGYSDGSGGGGGGGIIVLSANNIVGDLNLEMKGGNGGDVTNTPNRCFGSGGGGSGGRLVSDVSSNISVNMDGGKAGVNLVASTQCPNDPENGAQNGNTGLQTTFQPIPNSGVEQIVANITTEPISIIACENDMAIFEIEAEGTNLLYQWQVNNGSGWQDINNAPNMNGTDTPVLTLAGLDNTFHQADFRCIITNACGVLLTSEEAELIVANIPSSFSFDVIDQGGNQFLFETPPPPPFNGTYTFFWDFGDGNTSMEESPTHIYQNDGEYTVTLTVTNECGEIDITETVIIGDMLAALFSSNIDNPCAPTEVQFSDESTGFNIAEYEWVFEGGNPSTSTMQNPIVQYNQSGLYDVELTITNSAGEESVITKTDFVEILPTPIVDFDYVVNLYTVEFLDASDNADSWFWDFGDGNTSTEESPTHVYQNDGEYTVTLTVTNVCGQLEVMETVFVGEMLAALFSSNIDNPCAPSTVQFSDESAGLNIAEYEWVFEGGTPSTSTMESPSVQYATAGSFDVQLTITNTAGEESVITKTDYVEILPTPMVDFNFVTNLDTVQFMDSSDNADAWFWNFGDGNTSTEQSPQHVYDSEGIYQVTLTVSNMGCGSAISQEIMIDVTNAEQSFANQNVAKVFPNPFHDNLKIEMSEAPVFNANLLVEDLNGRILLDKKISEKSTNLELEDLNAGVYFIKIQNENRQIVFKVIKID